MTSKEELIRAKEVLIRGRARLEKGWCQGASARDENGYTVGANLPVATSFCIFGALTYEDRYDGTLDARQLVREVLGAKLGDGAIATYNDAPGRTKEEVLALVDKAIALAEEKIKGSIALAKEDE